MGGVGVVSFMTNTVVVLMYVIFVIKFFFCVTDLKKKQYFFTLGWSWMLLKLNDGKSYIYFHTH